MTFCSNRFPIDFFFWTSLGLLIIPNWGRLVPVLKSLFLLFCVYLSENWGWSSSVLCRRLIHGGQLLNGLAGPTIMSAGPFLSTTWFAPDQRATATAVATLFSYLGGATSFLVGPLLVPAPNDTLAGPWLGAAVSNSSIRGRIQLVMYAGTVNRQGPPRPGSTHGTSFQHHVSSVEGLKKFPQFESSRLPVESPVDRWDCRA